MVSGKIFRKLSLIILTFLLFTGVSISASAVTSKSISVEPKYTTVTEGFDWGPAITKVILNMNTTLNEGSVSKKTFNVKSERKYNGIDYKDLDTSLNLAHPYFNYDKITDRTITDAYVSDEAGNRTAMGNFVTIEMEVGPDLIEGSPFYYESKSGLNKYVDTSYNVSLNENETIINKDLVNVSVITTTEKDNAGNKTIVADNFELNGVSSYRDDTYGNITLHYASYTPKQNNEKNPLVIWLHGAGEGGKNPTVSIIGNNVVNLAKDNIQKIFGGAYILAPQCDTMWMNNGTGSYTTDGTTKYTKALMNLIEEYVKNHPNIDTNRIYIGGCSNGGFMTMNMIMKYSNYFAAAFPVCEAYTDKWITDDMLKKIKDMPIWFTQAATDTVVTPDTHAIPTYNRLISLGAKNVHFTYFDNVIDTTGKYEDSKGNPYEYNGHWSWIYTLNNQCTKDYDGSNVELNGKSVTIMEWLAAQKKVK